LEQEEVDNDQEDNLDSIPEVLPGTGMKNCPSKVVYTNRSIKNFRHQESPKKKYEVLKKEKAVKVDVKKVAVVTSTQSKDVKKTASFDKNKNP